MFNKRYSKSEYKYTKPYSYKGNFYEQNIEESEAITDWLFLCVYLIMFLILIGLAI